MINGFHVSPAVGTVPSSPEVRGTRSWLAMQSPLCYLKQSQDMGKEEKKFFSTGFSIPVPGRASPATQVSSLRHLEVPGPHSHGSSSQQGDADSDSREHSSTVLRQGMFSGAGNKFSTQIYCWIQGSNGIWKGFAFSYVREED